MTALKEFQRLEAQGLWRATEGAQRRHVVVSLGEATLVLSDMNDQALAHWSLAAVERANPGQRPARYFPNGDPGEELELDDDANDMIDAIERLRREIIRRRPRQGRLRWGLGATAMAAFLGLAVFWLPDALVAHTMRVVPDVKRDAIGRALLTEISRVSGPACRSDTAVAQLRMLSRRVLGPERAGDLVVLRASSRATAHLPGGFILLDRRVLEDTEDPEAAAGYVLVENLRAQAEDPLEALLRQAGMMATARLLTTGQLPDEALERFAVTLMAGSPEPLPDRRVIEAFHAARLHTAPYAYAVDFTGETTLPLIEADPLEDADAAPVMSDNDWLRLQAICGE
ncbi:MAG: hypothetical protein RID15_07050 [Marinovum algicola]|uniref:Uncharacterized protein n=1 Tax=Marinovum algicola TaxID=42444 RepID=A0A975W6A9_9RHOB|nr:MULTISPECIES: hypothetical protein [Marinovum]MDD9742650.1 hypothetical protein [Marinovum sp. PR37]SEI57121.1 hypothetical protein SAMN04487940_101259 [Marinovum algicola]SLN28165.1 hypothetical protein MAA5396_01198 [Marinovum algicola]